MRDTEVRQVQALVRISDFGEARAADFAASSLGGQKLAEVKALVVELDKLGETQQSAGGAARASAEAKRAARSSLLRQMRAIRETARAMESDTPGIASKFRVPTTNGDEVLINAARSFVVTATPLKSDFVKREMPADFLEQLSATIDEFERATNDQNLNTGQRVGTTAGVKNALSRATRLRKELDPIVRNKYRDDPASLAAWESASRVERAPKRKSKTKQPPPK